MWPEAARCACCRRNRLDGRGLSAGSRTARPATSRAHPASTHLSHGRRAAVGRAAKRSLERVRLLRGHLIRELDCRARAGWGGKEASAHDSKCWSCQGCLKRGQPCVRQGRGRGAGPRQGRRGTARPHRARPHPPVKWMYRLPFSKGRPWMGMPSPRMHAQESGLITPLLATSSTRSSRCVRWKWVPAGWGWGWGCLIARVIACGQVWGCQGVCVCGMGGAAARRA